MADGYLSAGEAAAELGISVATLYAYVSRGLVHSEPQPETRERRYRVSDIWALKKRKEHRRDPGKTAEDALHWGLPVLQSSLSLIADGQLYYRGRNVVELATANSIEQVAALLWIGETGAALPEGPLPDLAPEWDTLKVLGKALHPMARMQLFLPVAALRDSSAYDLRPASVQRTGLAILRLLAGVATGHRPVAAPLARTLQRRWAPRREAAAGLIDTALVLYADNELNPSTFTARCVASAGSTPYDVVTAGLAALQGFKHGGANERAEAVLREVADERSARQAVAARLRRGEQVPGFGHALYPQGDPRGALLMHLARERCRGSRDVAIAGALTDAVLELMGEHPTVDFGLATLCRGLGLPAEAPLTLLALGRAVGWIAHALEQYQEGRLIRPRARYTGEEPRR